MHYILSYCKRKGAKQVVLTIVPVCVSQKKIARSIVIFIRKIPSLCFYVVCCVLT